MFITMEEFQAKPPSERQEPLICFVGSSGSGKTTTALACDCCRFIPSVTDRPIRPNEPPHIALEIFESRGYPLLRITRWCILQEYIHASPEDFDSLERDGQFLWTYVSNRGNRYGTLEVLVQAALASTAEPSIMIITPASAIWLTKTYPGKVNCFFFEPPAQRMRVLRARESARSLELRLQEESLWAKQAEESDVPFILVPSRLRTRDKARLIKQAIRPPYRARTERRR